MRNRDVALMDAHKIIKLYERGAITGMEASISLFQIITANNVEVICSILPKELRNQLNEAVERCPDTEEEWNRVRISHMGGYSSVPRTPEEIKEIYEAPYRQFRACRAGVEALRAYFGEE